jgi:hypothetical protein
VSRPGAALLESLVAEERRGAPGPARDAALAAAEQGAEHLLDAAYALLVAGEPRAAARVLDRAEAAAGGGLERRIHACRVWASQLDLNWYPGETGAIIADEAGAPLLLGQPPPPEDTETAIVEACVAKGPLTLLTLRSLVESMVRSGSGALQSVLGGAVGELQAFATAVEAAGAPRSAVWAVGAQADLVQRSGLATEAAQFLETTRSLYAQLGDRVGLATTHLIEGDWHATPGSSPEALGLTLGPESRPSPLAAARDLARATACYDQAAALLEGVAAPRAAGALALRRAAVCWAERRHDDQRAWLDAADAAFAGAGDAAPRRVVTVHRLLAATADGELAALRLEAGTGWDLEARGPIAELVAWATGDGSASFGAGLGRLLERAAEAWRERGDLDRAALAYSMALPLVRLGGGILPAGVLDALAATDNERNFTARALVRLEQAVRALPPARPVADDPTSWMQRVSLVTGMVNALSARTGSSAAGLGITGFERATARLRELAAVPGLPDADVSASLMRDAGALIEDLQRAPQQDSVDSILGQIADTGRYMLALTAQGVRDEVARTTALAALQRGRLALRAGWTAEADGWFDAALETIDAGPPAHRWIAVLVYMSSLREEEARACFREVRDSGLVPDDLLASLALRAREYEAAEALAPARDVPDPSWSDLADRAELALETGDHAGALAHADDAIGRFEPLVGRLGRDPDRLAACDDVKATSLYLVAARAALAGGALARSFELSDRGRSLALATLVRGAAEAAPGDDALRRRWQQAATEWSAAFERLLGAYDGEDDAAGAAAAAVLTRADEALVAVEADVEARDPAALASARRLPAPVALADVQGALPEDGCLLQYHVVGRELLVWGVTRKRIEGARRRLDTAGVEALAGAYWRACSLGAAGAEGEELAALLLDPVAGIAGAARQLVVVPFGALATVPFHALPFGGAPLGHGRTVSFLPAASLLAGRRAGEPIGDAAAVLSVGDPAFDPAAQPALRRLPGAAAEARAVGGLWGSEDVLVDVDATEPELRERVRGRAILHLAAHGHLDEVAPSTSALVLAGADRLTVSDLIGLRLDAELAVLSACDSGRGAVTLGGDVIGLTRGLIAAGARRALVSLWPVDDVAACATMVAFHERLRESGVPAQALADAQADVRALSGDELAARYTAISGDAAPPAHTVRRGGGTPVAATARVGIPLDPSFVDADEPEAEPVAALDGGMERVWAPFILVGT